MQLHRKGRIPGPREERRFSKEKMVWARDSLCLKWWVEERAGVNQYPRNLITLEGWKRWPPSLMGAVEGEFLWLGVRQWISSVLRT